VVVLQELLVALQHVQDFNGNLLLNVN